MLEFFDSTTKFTYLVLPCLRTEEKAWFCSYLCKFFFEGGCVWSQFFSCLAISLGSTVFIFLPGCTSSHVFWFLVLLLGAAVNPKPSREVLKNAPFGNSPPNVNLILCHWLVWVVLRAFKNRHL